MSFTGAPRQYLGRRNLEGWRRAVLVTAACLLPGGVVAGAETPAPATAKPHVIVVVQPLRDAGGLPQLVKEGQGVNDRLTLALETYLNDHAAGRFAVAHKSAGTTASSSETIVFTLDGEISHVAIDDMDGGPYLCMLRLFREGSPRRLVGQWAGSARSLRYLTGNLKEQHNLDTAGLIGELGKRIIVPIGEFATADQITTFASFLTAAQSAQVTVSILPETAGAPTAGTAVAIKPGEHFQVQVETKDAGSVYLINLGPEGQPHSLLVPDASQDVKVTPGHPVLLPAKENLPSVDKNGANPPHIVALIRRSNLGARDIKPRVVVDNTPPHGDGEKHLDNSGPVQVIEAGTQHPPIADPAISRLLALASTDPPGTWIAAQVVVKVAAAPAG